MERKILYSEKAPAAIGPYSQAMQALQWTDILFTSGQIPIDPRSGQVVEGGIRAQTRQVLENLKEVLTAGGAGLGNVVKTTCFLNDMNDFAQFNEVYAEYFKDSPPARSCVAVERLPRDVLVEIEAIALL